MSIELVAAQRDIENDGSVEVSANHTVLTADKTIDMTTGATDKSVFLPTLAGNLGRRITVCKADAGAGEVVTDGDGAEPINGALTNSLTAQYESKTYLAFATEWRVV